MRVKYFCWDKYFNDSDLEEKFKEEDGYIILLSLTENINDYAKQIKLICNLIDILESWKLENFFKLNKTTYEINWFDCGRSKQGKESLTLPQAKRLYKETRAKYDVLYELFTDAARIHYEECPDHLIKEYFSEPWLGIDT